MNPHHITIRTAGDADRRALELLAGRDSAHLGRGAHLVAEAGGMPVAALPIAGGRTVADPFRHSAKAVALLELRRRQLEDRPERVSRRRRLTNFLLRRPAPAAGCC